MTSEEMLAKVMIRLSEVFKNQLILKGGMLLRLMNSPRSTQDIDYAWVRTKRRDVFGREVKETLESLDGIEVTDMKANSRGVFLEIRDVPSGRKAKVEINVVEATHLPPKPMSSAPLTRMFALKTQIIAAMDPAEAFAHKIAAALERNLARDLYDLSQMEPLTPFDAGTLADRLSGLEIGRAKARKVGASEAAELLKEKSDAITQKKIEAELLDTVPADQLPGLELVIRATVSRIVQRLRVLGA